MQDLEQIRTRLTELLRDEADCAQFLLESLKSESAALVSRDPKLVTINSANKRRLIKALQEASQQRIAFMDEHGLSSSPARIGDFDPQSPNGEVDALFVRLSQLAQQCFEENRIIGQLINRRTQFITQILRSLSPSADLQALTYEESGATDSDHHKSLFHLTKI